MLHVASTREPGPSADPTPQDPLLPGLVLPMHPGNLQGLPVCVRGSRGDSLSCGSWEKPFRLGVWPLGVVSLLSLPFSSLVLYVLPTLCMGDLSSAPARIPTLSYKGVFSIFLMREGHFLFTY